MAITGEATIAAATTAVAITEAGPIGVVGAAVASACTCICEDTGALALAGMKAQHRPLGEPTRLAPLAAKRQGAVGPLKRATRFGPLASAGCAEAVAKGRVVVVPPPRIERGTSRSTI